jgi:hypothetical protein
MNAHQSETARIVARFRAMAEEERETSNLLFESLADWNAQLLHAGIRFEELPK